MMQHRIQKKSIQLILLIPEIILLGLYYHGANIYLFVNVVEIHKFKAKDYEINAIPLCIGNISKDFSVDMKNYSELFNEKAW